jgi:hypothetical protein
MNPIRYEVIAPNIARVDVAGPQVQVTWKDPFTGREVGQSTGYMAPDQSLGSRVQASVKRNIVYEIVYGIARFIASRLGGTAGRIVSNATYTAAGDINYKATAGVDYTEASRQAAIVAAFEAVRSSFTWDEQGQRFVAGREGGV